MSAAEPVYEKVRARPGPRQREALQFIVFLSSRPGAEVQDTEWAKFSAGQLVKQYAAAEANYDRG
jgi:hypothetical protein